MKYTLSYIYRHFTNKVCKQKVSVQPFRQFIIKFCLKNGFLIKSVCFLISLNFKYKSDNKKM